MFIREACEHGTWLVSCEAPPDAIAGQGSQEEVRRYAEDVRPSRVVAWLGR